MKRSVIKALFDKTGGVACERPNLEGNWLCERPKGHSGHHMLTPGKYRVARYDVWDDNGNAYPPGPINPRIHKIVVEED